MIVLPNGSVEMLADLERRVKALEALLNERLLNLMAPPADTETDTSERPCGCEEAVALRAAVGRLRAENAELRAEQARFDESVDQGRAFWDHVDSGHPAIEREKATAGQLAAANALLECIRREMDDRGGDMSRVTWSRLEQHCDEWISRHPAS